jgi:hypothetical protein
MRDFGAWLMRPFVQKNLSYFIIFLSLLSGHIILQNS